MSFLFVICQAYKYLSSLLLAISVANAFKPDWFHCSVLLFKGNCLLFFLLIFLLFLVQFFLVPLAVPIYRKQRFSDGEQGRLRETKSFFSVEKELCSDICQTPNYSNTQNIPISFVIPILLAHFFFPFYLLQ